MTRTVRQYSDQERAAAMALAATVGPLQAAQQLGMPTRTLSRWMHLPAASPYVAAAERDIADQLRAAHAKALAAVLAGLDDPRARLGDKATALRVLGEQLALAEGRATANVHSVTTQVTADLDDDQRLQLRRSLDDLLAAQALDQVRADPLAVSRDDLLMLADALERRAGDR